MQGGRILVTGAKGFVGRAVLERLALEGHTGLMGGVRKATDALPVGIDPVVADLADGEAPWDSILSGVNVVVHCAARVHVMNETDDDSVAAYRRVNVDGTVALARAAAEAGVRRFVFLSSIKVNGESTLPGSPFMPDDPPAPADPYGRSKLEAEQALLELADQSGMEVVIIRAPLVYGPGVGGNFATMMRWVEKGIPLPLGAIDNRRSLVGLGNLVDFLLTCLHHPAAANRVWMVSDDDDVSTTELLRRVGRAVGRPARLIPTPVFLIRGLAALIGRRGVGRRLGDSLQVDISASRSRLGWEPPVTMAEELALIRKDG